MVRISAYISLRFLKWALKNKLCYTYFKKICLLENNVLYQEMYRFFIALLHHCAITASVSVSVRRERTGSAS